MKKITAIILATILIINGIVLMCLPASAESLDDNLVIHYDFKGDTLEEALTDKSVNGNVKDNLGVKSGATDTVADICTWDKENGTITNDKLQGRSVQAANSEDIRCLATRNATIFMRFKVQQFDDTNNTYLFSMRANWTNWSGLSLYVSANYRAIFANCYWNAGSGVQNYFFTPNYLVQDEDVYVNVALTIEPVDGQSYASVTAYYCFGEPTGTKDWIKGNSRNINVNNNGTANSPLSFFAMPAEQAGSGIVTFDDFRLYNKTLTPDEISSIFVSDTFDTIHTVGVQKKAGTAANTTDVRFLAITDYLEADAVGFKVEASYKDGGVLKTMSTPKFYESNKVYKSVVAMGSSVSAESLGGKYIVALVILGIPDSYTDVTFTVTPYRLYGDAKIYGDTVTVALDDIAF